MNKKVKKMLVNSVLEWSKNGDSVIRHDLKFENCDILDLVAFAYSLLDLQSDIEKEYLNLRSLRTNN